MVNYKSSVYAILLLILVSSSLAASPAKQPYVKQNFPQPTNLTPYPEHIVVNREFLTKEVMPEVDSSIKSSKTATLQANLSKGAQVTFKDNTNTAEAVRFEKDGYFFAYDLSGGKLQWREQPGFPARTDTLGGAVTSNSKDTQVSIGGNKATYQGAFSNTDVTYEVSNSKLKETFILYSLPSIKPYTYLEYTGNIKFSKELSICTAKECYTPKGTQDDFETSGQIDFRDASGNTIFFLNEPIIYDAKNKSVKGIYSVHGSDAQMNFWLRIPTSFIQSATFPLYIDPSIQFSSAQTASFSVAPLDTRTFVLAYCDRTNSSMKFIVYNANGSIITNTTTIDDTSSNCQYYNQLGTSVSVSAFNSTTFVVGWRDETPRSMSFIVYDIYGNVITNRVDIPGTASIGTYSQSISTSAFDDNSFVIAWYGPGGSGNYTFSVYDINGSVITAPVEVINTITGSNSAIEMQVSAFDSNSFVIGWWTAFVGGERYSERFSTYLKNGTKIVGPIVADVVSAQSQFSTSVSALNNNTFVMGWGDENPTDRATFMVFNKTGSVLANITVQNHSSSIYNFAIGAINESAFALAFDISAGSIVYLYTYNQDGTKIAGPISIQSSGIFSAIGGYQAANGIRISDKPSFVFAYYNTSGSSIWKTFNADGSGWGGTIFNGSGDGTGEDPFGVSTCSQLQEMRSFLNANYILSNDIDCTDTINWNGGRGFIPIGGEDYFQGTLDGLGHNINNLYMNNLTLEGGGLFDYVYLARIMNVNLVNANITGSQLLGALGGVVSYSNVTNISATGVVNVTKASANMDGGLIAYFLGDWSRLANLRDSHASVKVITDTSSNTGGLVGDCENAIIDDTYSTGNVNAGYRSRGVGGLVGLSYGCNISNSYSSSAISGEYWLGGLVGDCEADSGAGVIYRSYSTGVVNSSTDRSSGYMIGGLMGLGGCRIEESYSTSNVYGGGWMGGLIGEIWLDTAVKGGGNVTNCYARGNVTSTSQNPDSDGVGGLIGIIDNAPQLINNSYSTGFITRQNATGNYGGLVGLNSSSSVMNSFWDMNTSNMTTSKGGKGKSTLQMKWSYNSENTFGNWSIGNYSGGTIWVNDVNLIQNNGYPELAWAYTTSVIFRSSAGVNLVIFDKLGNLYTKGIFSTTLGSPASKYVLFKNATGSSIGWINNTGVFRILGSITSSTGEYCVAPSRSFVIRDSAGNCVSYLGSNGSLWLRGSLNENATI